MDIDGDDLSLRDEWGDAEAVVAGASADVGDDGVRCEIQEGYGFGRSFFLFTVVAFEPADARVAHDLRNLAAHEDFTDAIRGGGGGGVAGWRRGRGDWGRGRLGEFLDGLIAQEGERDEEDPEKDDGDEDEVAGFHLDHTRFGIRTGKERMEMALGGTWQ